MATGQYIGVNGVARKVVSPYVGVEGVARNVQSGYVGVNGVARLFFAPESGAPAVLEVKKITSDTRANETTYTAEEFFLLDIYPKTGGTVKVTYGGLTKTITDTSGAEAPNAKRVFFGTFNGVTDAVETPGSGTLTIDGAYRGYSEAYFNTEKSNTEECECITAITDFGSIEIIPDYAFFNGNDITQATIEIPEGVTSIGISAFRPLYQVRTFIIPSTVSSIGNYAFDISLWDHDYIMRATIPPTLGKSVFSFGSEGKIFVPNGCGDTYKAASGWSEYAKRIIEEA